MNERYYDFIIRFSVRAESEDEAWDELKKTFKDTYYTEVVDIEKEDLNV